MNSREKILAAVKANQPAMQPLPGQESFVPIEYNDKLAQFTAVLKTIGGTVIAINSIAEIADYVNANYTENTNYVTTIPQLPGIALLDEKLEAHFLENIEVAVVKALFGVAENGSVWVTDAEVKIRALPFICQHLAVVLQKSDLVNNMQQAYKLIGSSNYNFGVFIAGPSKTADIEQSLVLGAHGPKTMTVFIVQN